jgi:hypothetical protein
MSRLFGVGLAIALAGSSYAASGQTSQPEVTITITPTLGGGLLSVPLTDSQIYLGARGGVGGLDLSFGLGAWREAGQARVVVYAILPDKRAPQGQTQTPIATFLLAHGKAVEIKEALKWGGPLLTVGSEVKVR